jgi:predicted MPP superfamily phosphohydrolase
LLAAAVGVWAFWLEPRSLRVREHALALPGWPSGLAGLRIAVLTDLHVGSPFNDLAHLRRIVALTNEARPEIVLVTGDLVILGVVGGTFVEPEPIAAELGRLTAPLGVWATLGNHDHWHDARRVQRALEAVGIRVLENDAARIRDERRGDAAFWLVGIADFWTGGYDVRAALAPVTDDAPIVAMTHNPDVFPELPSRVALLIAGHTHGGQVWLPFVGRPIVPSAFGQRYAAGSVVEAGRHLFVATGTGMSILPVRFLVPPEVSILILQAADDAERR